MIECKSMGSASAVQALSLINFFKPQPRATVILCRVTEDLRVGYLLWASCLPCMLSGCSSFPGLVSCRNWQEENKLSAEQSSKVESSGLESSWAAAMRAKRIQGWQRSKAKLCRLFLCSL